MARSLSGLAVSADSRSYQLAAFIIGLFLQFNLVPLAWHIPVPRFTLLIMVPCIAFLIHYLITRSNRMLTVIYCAAALAFIALHLAFSGTLLVFGNGNTDLSVSLSYALYMIGGVAVYIFLAQRSGTAFFCWGILVGALLSLIVFVMEANGLTGTAIALGLTQPLQSVQETGPHESFSRLTGMWGHANEVGHVLAMTAPAACYLFVSRGEKLPLVMLAIIIGVCFSYTINRGGIIATLLTVAFAFLLRSSTREGRRQIIIITLIALALVTYALYFLPPPEILFARFTVDSNADQNTAGRIQTTLAGLQIALTHPFGLASVDWRRLLVQQTGFRTPHNGFLAMSFVIGSVFTLFYIAAEVIVVRSGLRRQRRMSLDLYLLLASAQIIISLMFEELADVDPFILLISVIMARAFSGAIPLTGRPLGQRVSRGTRSARQDPEPQQPAVR